MHATLPEGCGIPAAILQQAISHPEVGVVLARASRRHVFPIAADSIFYLMNGQRTAIFILIFVFLRKFYHT